MAVVVFGVYLPTIAPGIAGGDAGELVAESCHLGTAHPPGYPLFTMLNFVTTQVLPNVLESCGLAFEHGLADRMSPAWYANATTAVMGALAASFVASSVALLCDRLRVTWELSRTGGDRDPRRWCHDSILRSIASGCAGTVMAFSPLFWQYSVTAEVFALNNFLLSWLCYLSVRFAAQRNVACAVWGAFVCGLALSNQHTAVLYVAPLTAWVMIQLIISRCRLRKHPWRDLAVETPVLVFAFILGLIPYAYLPLVARRAPRPGSWGNVTTLRGMWHHLRRGDYGSLRLYSGGAGGGGQGFLERLRRWGVNVVSVQGLDGIVPVFAAFGMLTIFSPPVAPAAPPRNGITPPQSPSQSTCAPVSGCRTSGEAIKPGLYEVGKCRARGSALPNDRKQSVAGVVRFLASLDDNGSSVSTALLLALVGYLGVFHLLSNMPLDDPLLFGVHARFWMQPNMLVFMFFGVGTYRAFDIIR